jgi:adenine-specific DNA methylase
MDGSKIIPKGTEVHIMWSSKEMLGTVVWCDFFGGVGLVICLNTRSSKKIICQNFESVRLIGE